MQSFQIDGTYTYIDNVKTLKLGDIVFLRKNPKNNINKEAVGVYTKNNHKIGYMPLKSSQLEMDSQQNIKYSVTKINLTLEYPQILISREYEMSNIIKFEPRMDTNKRIETCDGLKEFSRFLKHSGHNITDIYVSYMDLNFIDIIIHTPDSITKYYTVTKKYYEDNIFYYDELYKFNLIPRCIYMPFMTHRLEVYIMNNYKPLEKLLRSKKLKIDIFDVNFEEKDNIILDDIKHNAIAYNHNMKIYCYIDMYNDNMIASNITSNITIDIKKEIILKSIISNKNIITIINSKNNKYYQYNITETMKDSIINKLI
jgi:hypothetical protein